MPLPPGYELVGTSGGGIKLPAGYTLIGGGGKRQNGPPPDSALQRLLKGFFDVPSNNPPGADAGDLMEMLGAQGLEMTGSVMGGIAAGPTALMSGPVGPATGMGIGAGAGKAVHNAAREAALAAGLGPAAAEPISPVGAIADPVVSGLAETGLAKGLPMAWRATEPVRRPLVQGLRGLGKMSGRLVGISSEGMDRALGRPEKVFSYNAAQEGAEQGAADSFRQSVGSFVDKSKEAYRTARGEMLSKDTIPLTQAEKDAFVSGLKSQAQAAEEKATRAYGRHRPKQYQWFMEQRDSLVKQAAAGAPASRQFRFNLQKGIGDAAGEIRAEFGYGSPMKSAPHAEAKVFDDFLHDANALADATLEQVSQFDKNLTAAIMKERVPGASPGTWSTTRLGAALKKLRSSFDDALAGTPGSPGPLPELRALRAQYAEAKGVEAAAKPLMRLQNLPYRVRQAYTGRSRDIATMEDIGRRVPGATDAMDAMRDTLAFREFFPNISYPWTGTIGKLARAGVAGAIRGGHGLAGLAERAGLASLPFVGPMAQEKVRGKGGDAAKAKRTSGGLP